MKKAFKKTFTNPLIYILLISAFFQKYIYSLYAKFTIVPDTRSYIEGFKQNIFNGEVNGFRTPVFPYFCRIIQAIGGKDNLYSNVVLVHKILFFLSIILFFYTVKKVFNKNSVATICTLTYSLSPFLFLWNTVIITEALTIVELVALLYLTVCYLKKPNKWCGVLIGLLLFIMIMTRPANLYLLVAYFAFWIIKLLWENKKDEKKFIKTGLISTVVAIILTLFYCLQVKNQYGTFSLSTVSDLNNMTSLIASGQYRFGNNEEIIKSIDANFDSNDMNTVWNAANKVLKNHTKKEIKSYKKSSLFNSKRHYIRYMMQKALDIGTSNIGIIYAGRIAKDSFIIVGDVAYFLFPLSLSLVYIILIITFIYVLAYLMKHKKFDWIATSLFVIIGGNIFTSLFFAPFETQRLSVISIPGLIILIPYMLLCSNKNYQEKVAKKVTKKKKKSKKTGINELLEYIVTFNIKSLFKEKTNNTFIQFFRYIFVGGIAAVVNIGMLYVFTDICHIHYVVSNVLSFALGLIVNYLLSKKFVFQEETSISKTKEFLIYSIIGIIGLGIDTLLVWLFTDVASFYYMISKLVSTAIVFIWNFGARKLLYKVIK